MRRSRRSIAAGESEEEKKKKNRQSGRLETMGRPSSSLPDAAEQSQTGHSKQGRDRKRGDEDVSVLRSEHGSVCGQSVGPVSGREQAG
jgi:plasmid stabilization system protein ParE